MPTIAMGIGISLPSRRLAAPPVEIPSATFPMDGAISNQGAVSISGLDVVEEAPCYSVEVNGSMNTGKVYDTQVSADEATQRVCTEVQKYIGKKIHRYIETHQER